jgi:hypothetical protein
MSARWRGRDGGIKRGPTVGRRRIGHRAQRLTGRGVHDVERAPIRRVYPFAVDEESLVDGINNVCLAVLVH